MTNVRHKRAIRKHIARRGQPVELRLFEAVDGGSQGDFANELMTVESRAIVDTSGAETDFNIDLVFTDVESDVIVYLRDDVTEGLRAENWDGDTVRPLITSVDTTIESAATEIKPLNSNPFNRSRIFKVVQAHDWADAGCIVCGCEVDTPTQT